MRKQISIVFCLSLLIINFICTPAMAARETLDMSAYLQEKSNWCWAACSKSTIKHCTKSSPSQTDIVKYIFSKDVNKAATISQTKRALANWNVTSSSKNSSLSYTAVQHQINNNSPIFAGLKHEVNGKTYGHFNLIQGYDTSYDGVLFIDSADGDYHGQNYDDFSNGMHYNGVNYEWYKSIFDCQ